PPAKLVRAHRLPIVKRDAPVLSPFDRELVVFEIRLGRSATTPIEQKFFWSGENVGAVITHSKWDIAHKRDTAVRRMCSRFAPLTLRDPLDIRKEDLAANERGLLISR